MRCLQFATRHACGVAGFGKFESPQFVGRLARSRLLVQMETGEAGLANAAKISIVSPTFYFGTVGRTNRMKKPSIAGVAAGALLFLAPVSFGGSASNSALPVKLQAAKAAELEVAPQRRVRHGRYYGVAIYDRHCGGPYVGGGWNGGTYWGGPWMDLRCYGVPVAEVPAPNAYWWYW
jgi:hypothetical protein